MEVYSDAQHDLSTDDPTAADWQPEPSTECYQAADEPPSPISNAEHEPSVEPFGTEHDVESVHEQFKLVGRAPATAWLTNAVGTPDVRSHVGKSDEWQPERPIGRRVHLLEPASSAAHEHGAKSIHAVEE